MLSAELPNRLDRLGCAVKGVPGYGEELQRLHKHVEATALCQVAVGGDDDRARLIPSCESRKTAAQHIPN